MAKLKLGAVADDKPVKLTVEFPATIHRDLVAYAEILARVPRGLPGRMPGSATDLLFPILRAPRDRTPDPALIEQVVLRHGFTREEAIGEILRFGG